MKQRGNVAGTVVGRENKRMQQRHLPGVERASELGRLSFFFRAGNLSALDSLEEFLLERSENLIAPFRVLLMLLIIVEPKRRIHADKDKHQLREPTAET